MPYAADADRSHLCDVLLGFTKVIDQVSRKIMSHSQQHLTYNSHVATDIMRSL